MALSKKSYTGKTRNTPPNVSGEEVRTGAGGHRGHRGRTRARARESRATLTVARSRGNADKESYLFVHPRRPLLMWRTAPGQTYRYGSDEAWRSYPFYNGTYQGRPVSEWLRPGTW
jgi:hypothetical protein